MVSETSKRGKKAYFQAQRRLNSGVGLGGKRKRQNQAPTGLDQATSFAVKAAPGVGMENIGHLTTQGSTGKGSELSLLLYLSEGAETADCGKCAGQMKGTAKAKKGNGNNGGIGSCRPFLRTEQKHYSSAERRMLVREKIGGNCIHCIARQGRPKSQPRPYEPISRKARNRGRWLDTSWVVGGVIGKKEFKAESPTHK